MPRMHEATPTQTLVKLFVCGDGKIGKSYYAALAAKAGFRVLYLDGDVGAATISSMVKSGALTREEASRIYLLDIADTIEGGARDTKMCEFMNEFVSVSRVRWNDTKRRLAKHSDTGDEIWEIRPGLMGPNDLIVMDSWTAYAESVMLWVARANSVDLSTAKVREMRPVYQGGGLKTTEMLQVIRSLRTHMIAIGHPDEFVHTTKPQGRTAKDIKEDDLVVDWTKLIPKSTSKPQGLLIPKYFTDFAWMVTSPAGTERRMDFKPKGNRVGGGHFTDEKTTEEYSFINLVKQIGGAIPNSDAPMEWLKIITPEQQAANAAAKAESKVLDGTKATPIQGGGMQALFAKKGATTQPE